MSTPRDQRDGARWIMLMPTLAGSATSQRVRIWRRLQAIGAVAVKQGVYVLPAKEECVEAFQWVARELGELGGHAALCEGQFRGGLSDEDIERRFIEARNADYATVTEKARALAKKLAKKRLSAEAVAEAEAQRDKLKRRFDEIAGVDFCGAPGRESAAGVLDEIAHALVGRKGAHTPAELERAPRPKGATWVTRTGVHVDRIACAWLIRRFIDPDGALKFVAPRGYVPARGEVRFDMYDAEFTHVGDRCSFEVLLVRMGIEDGALAAIGEIVHDIDLKDDKFARAETAGVKSAVTGVCAAQRDDAARIAAASPLFDALHAYFSLHRRGG